MTTKIILPKDMGLPAERALQILCVPVLARIQWLELVGHLPALAPLSEVGSYMFDKTVKLLEEDPLGKQITSYLLQKKWVRKTREGYDHHVTLTPAGVEFLKYTVFKQTCE